MDKKRVVIIGGGASGLMASIAAAENGAAVTILEQNEKPGKKNLRHRKRKSNFTNLQKQTDAYRSDNPGFWEEVLNQFSVENTVDFFTELGLYPVNKNKRISLSPQRTGSSVAEVLCMKARSLGVKTKPMSR